jgi:hypothetical protein
MYRIIAHHHQTNTIGVMAFRGLSSNFDDGG